MLSQAACTKIERLNGFERAWEFACRRSTRGGSPMSIVRTGIAEQPFRVTAEPDADAEVAAQVLP